MPSVGLIASQNGLGHARRLVHFSASFQDLGYEVFLYLSNRQIRLLSEEIRLICRQTKICEIHTHGLDGPTCSVDQVLEIPERLSTDLRNLDFIVSDNVTWPGSVSDSFILMGHFSWIDYWGTKDLNNFRSSIKQSIAETRRISKWFTPKDFSHVPVEMKHIETVEIPLSRYKTDESAPRHRSNSEIWHSIGTTGLNQFNTNGLEADLRKLGLDMKTRETHDFRSSKLPALVLGRPGLGTIRDCLALSLPFLPCWIGEDLELSRNQDTLKRIGLIPHDWEGNQSPDINTLRNFISNNQIQDKISEYWLENSAPIIEIIALMGLKNSKDG